MNIEHRHSDYISTLIDALHSITYAIVNLQ